jgi:signal transduction histidine kinase
LLFKQVLFNIFLNSIQAMPNGGKIQMNINHGSANMTKINISDQGEGIAENKITKIFDPLYTDKDEGVGLGLSLCKDLISRHGGTIKAISGQPPGATIEIEIPS